MKLHSATLAIALAASTAGVAHAELRPWRRESPSLAIRTVYRGILYRPRGTQPHVMPASPQDPPPGELHQPAIGFNDPAPLPPAVREFPTFGLMAIGFVLLAGGSLRRRRSRGNRLRSFAAT